MRTTQLICDHCGLEAKDGLAVHKLIITRPPEWFGSGGIFGDPITATVPMPNGMPPSSGPLEETEVELCRSCDTKVSTGLLNLREIKTSGTRPSI